MTCPECDEGVRPAEGLVLDGYRHWTAGVIAGDTSYWDRLAVRCHQLVGLEDGRRAYEALLNFTRVLGRCAAGTLLTCEIGCVSVCKHELLLLGLITGLQHKDETTVALCLDGLTCPARFNEVLLAAENLAKTLLIINQRLQPIPSPTIKAILLENSQSKTVH